MSVPEIGRDAPHAKRIRQLMRTMNRNSTKFAHLLGVSVQRINNVENGAALGIDLALKIVGKTGVGLDWLYRGVTDGLTVALAGRLAEHEKEVLSSRPNKVKDRRRLSRGGG